MYYVYCFVQGAKERTLFPRGLNGQRVSVVSAAGIGAVVSEGIPATVSPEVENVLVHQEVVSRALELSRSIIPCRFGVWVADETGVMTLLSKNASRLEAHFARLEGKIEIEIKALLSGQQGKRKVPAKGLTVGEKYLLAKREKYYGTESLSAQGQGLCQKLNESTAPFWTAVKAEEISFRQKLIMRLVYLVERENLDCFTSAYERACQHAPQGKFLYTGPWPPYSFADISLFRV
ncbi:MAG TPA: GvpL/GvpF family gas vesicle protein [Candidatus Binatia bacterium]|jgi:hypothetical protein|nr:GvpL/GvpF family gas vesicle protein [Candidatus Binatia bacterium]